ncbi:MAG: hypothetical protein ABIL68_02745 [bacterium]
MFKYLLIWITLIFITACSNTKRITAIGERKESHLTIQKVVKVVPKYVVLETDVGIREVYDEVSVFRLSNPRMKNVGKIKLLKYHDGKAVGRIIEEKERLKIQAGDYIYLHYKSLDEMSVGEYLEFLGGDDDDIILN